MVATLAVVGLAMLPAVSQQRSAAEIDPFGDDEPFDPDREFTREELLEMLPKMIQVQVGMKGNVQSFREWLYPVEPEPVRRRLSHRWPKSLAS